MFHRLKHVLKIANQQNNSINKVKISELIFDLNINELYLHAHFID